MEKGRKTIIILRLIGMQRWKELEEGNRGRPRALNIKGRKRKRVGKNSKELGNAAKNIHGEPRGGFAKSGK